jgi:hypothetical protein
MREGIGAHPNSPSCETLFRRPKSPTVTTRPAPAPRCLRIVVLGMFLLFAGQCGLASPPLPTHQVAVVKIINIQPMNTTKDASFVSLGGDLVTVGVYIGVYIQPTLGLLCISRGWSRRETNSMILCVCYAMCACVCVCVQCAVVLACVVNSRWGLCE